MERRKAVRVAVALAAALVATACITAAWLAPGASASAATGFGPKWSVCGLGIGLVMGGALWARLSPGGGLLAFSAGVLLMAAGCN